MELNYTEFSKQYIRKQSTLLPNYIQYYNKEVQKVMVKKIIAKQIPQSLINQKKFHELCPQMTIQLLHYTCLGQSISQCNEYLIAFEQADQSLKEYEQKVSPIQIAQELLRLVVYLQENNMKHNNLTVNNILVKDGKLKLTDFYNEVKYDDQAAIAEIIRKLSLYEELPQTIKCSISSLTTNEGSEFNTVLLAYGLIIKMKQLPQVEQKQLQAEESRIKFMGELINGQREGPGILEIDGRVVYKGSFKNNKFDGWLDVYEYNLYLSYDGEFKNGLKHGLGCYYKKQQFRRQGEYSQGIAIGIHKEFNFEGKYIGEFKYS